MDNFLRNSPVTVSPSPWVKEDLYQALFAEIPSGGGDSIVCDPGSFSFTGSPSTIKVDRKIQSEVGSYAYTGSSALFSVSRPISAGAGNFPFNGTSVGIKSDRKLSAEQVSYPLTPQNAALSVSRKIICEESNYMFTAFNADFKYEDVVNLPGSEVAVTMVGSGYSFLPSRRKKRKKYV